MFLTDMHVQVRDMTRQFAQDVIRPAAEALDEDIRIDPKELESAMWVEKDEMREALAGRHPVIAPARHGAIARFVLEAWVEGRIPDFG